MLDARIMESVLIALRGELAEANELVKQTEREKDATYTAHNNAIGRRNALHHAIQNLKELMSGEDIPEPPL